MKKILMKIGLVLVVCLVVLYIARNGIVKFAVEAGVKTVVGQKLSIGDLRIAGDGSSIEITDMKLFNPKGFQDKVMVDLPDIYVSYDLGKVLKKSYHFPELRLHLKEMLVVKNKDGEMNINNLKSLAEAPKEDGASEKSEKDVPDEPKKKEDIDFFIGRLSFKVDKVVYKDYSGSGDEPTVKEFNINIDKTYENLTSPDAIVRLVVAKTLMSTPLAVLPDFGDLDNVLSGSLKGVTDVAGDVLGTTTDLLKDNANLLKDKGNDLKKMIKLPFGKK